MSLRPTYRAACRALALRSRPAAAAAAAPRHEFLGSLVSRRRYADDSTQKPHAPSPLSRAPDSKAASEASRVPKAQNSTTQGISTVISDEEAIDQLEAALANLSQDPTDGKEYDALAEEAAADTSGVTVEEAMAELEAAARVTRDGPGMKDGLTPEQEEHLYREGSIPPIVSTGDAQHDLEVIASGGLLTDAAVSGSGSGNKGVLTDHRGRTHKWPLPTLPLGPQSKLQARYHPVLDQVTNLIMRHGKKSVAQRNMAMILNFLRTSPPPILSQKNPLLAGHPPASHLPLNPVLYLTLVVDSVAPLIHVKYIKGAAGGGRALEMPVPLSVRQRRRAAVAWILDSVNKKRSTGSGRTQLAHRIANEIISVAEGRSSVWDKRLGVHKLGTASRANMNAPTLRRKGGGKRLY